MKCIVLALTNESDCVSTTRESIQRLADPPIWGNDVSEISRHADYRQALIAIKQRIQTSQTRAVLAVNAELLGLYWDIGRQLEAWQRERAWGSAVVEQMAQDLQASYPGMKGFSRSSLFAMRQFYAFFSPQFEVVPQPVGQMPWWHVRTLLAKIKSVDLVLLYARACTEHGWSRTVLEWQIEQRYHERAGQAVGNFAQTLPAPQSELVQQRKTSWTWSTRCATSTSPWA
jgi:predicted nuclease of restriction endonuclease-like (RecB) superfamily